jgi:hypothetical protein
MGFCKSRKYKMRDSPQAVKHIRGQTYRCDEVNSEFVLTFVLNGAETV